MTARAADRIPLKLKITFSCGKETHSGIVTNLSEKGMFIRIENQCDMLDQEFELSIPVDDRKINLKARQVRSETIKGFPTGVGVRLINPPKAYRIFVHNLMSVL